MTVWGAGALRVRLKRAGALGAIAAQLSQALGSFALQVLAARALGAAGLGLFALVYSVIVMTTALSTGLIGDSLTILDRQRDALRSALQRWGVMTALTSGFVAAVAAAVSQTLSLRGSLLLGAALAVFLMEDSLRRLLMASARFWFLVLVDCAGLVGSLSVLGLSAMSGRLSIETFLLALLLGQTAAGVVAIPLLPRVERRLAPWRPAAMAEVARFGFWRGTQQGIRPTMLTVARVLIILAAGRVAFGELEASRVYMAPAILLVQGVGTYLLTSYARRKHVALEEMLHRADRASALMLGVAVVLGGLATVGAPVLGPLVTGGRYDLAPVAVFGWAMYAASAAAVMPFASLAAVRGRQPLIVAIRVADSALSVLCLWLVLFVLGSDVSWAPYALAVGSFVGGFVIRMRVLKPLCRNTVTPSVAPSFVVEP
jgi:O-antigen/teichoic acid export membrane protein